MRFGAFAAVVACCALASVASAQAWHPDLGTGRYRNPVIFADYSDPDVIRVGGDFFLVASSFNAVPALRPSFIRTMEPGSAPIDHGAASDDGYRVTANVDGRRLLLIDDTYTSGARVQSAASALQLAGASLVAVVVVGRIIDVEYKPENRALWDRAGEVQFSFEACCLE